MSGVRDSDKKGRTTRKPTHQGDARARDDVQAQAQMAFTFAQEPDLGLAMAPSSATAEPKSITPPKPASEPQPIIEPEPPSERDADVPPNVLVLSGAEMLVILRDWARRGWLRELDRAFAAFLMEQVPAAPALLLLGAALASHQLGRGHVCVTLADTLHDPRFALSLPPEESAAFQASGAVLASSDGTSWGGPPMRGAPFNHVADDPRALDTFARRVAERALTPEVLLNGIDVAVWRSALLVPGLVTRVATSTMPAMSHVASAMAFFDPPPDAASPLVLAETDEGDARLYLRRYWRYEQAVRTAIFQRVAAPTSRTGATTDGTLRALLNCLFPPSGRLPTDVTDWQKLACALMTRQRFGVITGGPGTGKTTTVVRLLALLQCLALSDGGASGVPPAQTADASMATRHGTADGPHRRGRALRIRLAAPTGKAAARLNDAISRAVASLPLCDLAALLPPTTHGEGASFPAHVDIATAAHPDSTNAIVARLRAAIPTEVTTLHRLLGSRPDSRRFRHDADTPLALDVLVIDEASMVDLEMMAAVLAALPTGARLILLGDKDQLASVEAGAVLGELCARAQQGHYTPETCAWIASATGASIDASLRDPDGAPLDQAIAMLRHSHRFTADSGIGRLAHAVNEGDARALREIRATPYSDLAYVALSPASDVDATVFRNLVIHGGVSDADVSMNGTLASAADTPASRSGYARYLRVLREQAPHGALTADGTAPGVAVPIPDARHGLHSGTSAFGEARHDRVTSSHPFNVVRDDYDNWARAVLDAYGGFQMLCALRRGEWGVDGLNDRIARTLHEAGLIALPSMRQVRAPTPWYVGRPVLVTRNDYGLGLMNGDIGMTLIGPPSDPANVISTVDDTGATIKAGTPPFAAQTGMYERAGQGLSRLRVAFLASDGSRAVKWVLPSRLQAVETVFAMTVHKSQGSEFAHAALVLPPRMNPILTRELVYTGMTRARQWLTLASAARDDHVLMQSIERRVLRASGLMR